MGPKELFGKLPGGKTGVLLVILTVITDVGKFITSPGKDTFSTLAKTLGKTLVVSQKNLANTVIQLKTADSLSMIVLYLFRIVGYTWITYTFLWVIFMVLTALLAMGVGRSRDQVASSAGVWVIAVLIYIAVYDISRLVLFGTPDTFWKWIFMPVEGWFTLATNIITVVSRPVQLAFNIDLAGIIKNATASFVK